MTKSLRYTYTLPITRPITRFLNYRHIVWPKSNASLRITRLWKIKSLSWKIFLISQRHWRVLRKQSNATGSIGMHSLMQTGTKKEHKCARCLGMASAPARGSPRMTWDGSPAPVQPVNQRVWKKFVHIALEDVTVLTPNAQRTLVEHLPVHLPPKA